MLCKKQNSCKKALNDDFQVLAMVLSYMHAILFILFLYSSNINVFYKKQFDIGLAHFKKKAFSDFSSMGVRL